MLKTVQTSGKILNLFTLQNPEWGVTEVAHFLNLPKTNVGKILSSLAAENLIVRTPRGRYRLGVRTIEFGQIMLETSEFYNEVRRVMLEQAYSLNGNLFLARLNGNRVIIIEKIQVNVEIQKLLNNIGPGLPLHCSAAGKTFLAYMDWAQAARLLDSENLENFTPYTVTDLNILQNELKKVRENCFAEELEELTFGIGSIASPIFDADGSVKTIAGLIVPANHFEEKKQLNVKLITRIAQQISRILLEGICAC